MMRSENRDLQITAGGMVMCAYLLLVNLPQTFKGTLTIPLVSISLLRAEKTNLKMKSYYAECTVSFTDNSEEEPWKSSETYSYIIEANNKKEGKANAKERAITDFNEDFGEMDDIKVVVDTFCETFDGARAN